MVSVIYSKCLLSERKPGLYRPGVIGGESDGVSEFLIVRNQTNQRLVYLAPQF